MPEKLSWSIKSTREELARLIDEASVFVESRSLSPQVIYKVNLTLEEILTNIVKYAFPYDHTSSIDVILEMTESAVCIQIADQGREFDPCSFLAPHLGESILECDEGGRGIHLVRQAANSMDYRRENGKNVLTIMIRP